MLLQEFVSDSISTDVPDGWEKEMAREEGKERRRRIDRHKRELVEEADPEQQPASTDEEGAEEFDEQTYVQSGDDNDNEALPQ